MKAAFCLLFVGVGFLLIGVAMPLVRRRVGPNRLYGLRVPATYADEWVWYEANARSGRDLIYVGILQITVAALLAVVPALADFQYAIANAVVLFVSSISAAAIGWKRANRLLSERRHEPA